MVTRHPPELATTDAPEILAATKTVAPVTISDRGEEVYDGLFGGKIGKHKSITNPQALNTKFSGRQECRGRLWCYRHIASAGVHSRQLWQGGLLRRGYCCLLREWLTNTLLGYTLSVHCASKSHTNTPIPIATRQFSLVRIAFKQLLGFYYYKLGQRPLEMTHRSVLLLCLFVLPGTL